MQLDSYQIGVIVAALLAVIGIVKMEFIREMVKRVVSGKENVSFFSVVILIIIVVLPVVIGVSLSATEPEKKEVEEVVEKEKVSAKSDLETAGELAKYAVEETKGIIQTKKQKQRERDSIFNATRHQRWVYQLGEIMDNEDAILASYNRIKHIPNICLFRNGSQFFFFRDEEFSKEQLVDSLTDFRLRIMNSMPVRIVDLMASCKRGKEKLIKTKSQKFGRKKEKITIDCYKIDS